MKQDEKPQDNEQNDNISEQEAAKLLEDIQNSVNEDDAKDREIASLKAQIDEQKDKFLRLFADFDNFKKRTAKEKLELIQTAGKDIILSLLPILDDFERALKANNGNDTNATLEGMNLIHNKLLNNLQQKGLKSFDSMETEFNVEHHEAVTEIPAPTPDLEGKVVDELEKGYYLNDKLIRFAKVVVGKKA